MIIDQIFLPFRTSVFFYYISDILHQITVFPLLSGYRSWSTESISSVIELSLGFFFFFLLSQFYRFALIPFTIDSKCFEGRGRILPPRGWGSEHQGAPSCLRGRCPLSEPRELLLRALAQLTDVGGTDSPAGGPPLHPAAPLPGFGGQLSPAR